MQSDWSPEDYIVRHQFCTTGSIRSFLEGWRATHAQDWVLLLPFTSDPGTVFGSLMILSSSTDTAHLQAALIDATRSDSTAELEPILRGLAEVNFDGLTDGQISDLLATEIIRSIEPLTRRHRSLGLYRIPEWSASGGVRHFVLGPGYGTTSPGGIELVADEGLAELDLMLHATNQVVMHLHDRSWRPSVSGDGGDTNIGRRSWHRDLESLRIPPDASHFGPEHAYEDLLQQSNAVRHRDSAALYLIGRTGRNLRLVVRNSAPRAPEAVELDDDSSPLSFVVIRNRPRVTNRVVTEPTMHSDIRSAWIGPDPTPYDFSEAVVPITSSAVGKKRSVVGALAVQRAADEPVFDVRDLADLEQLAVRISLRRANLLFTESTDRLAELAGQSLLASAGARVELRLDDPWRQVPADHLLARSTLDRALLLAYQYTSANLAILYLLNTSQDQLVAVAHRGDPDAEMPGAVHTKLSGKKVQGLASIAFSSGRDAVIHDVEDPDQVRRFRGKVSKKRWDAIGAKAGVAIPVTVYDRTVGILFLESLRGGAFASTHRFLRAVAQQMGLSLLLAQRAAEQRAFAFASGTAVHAHEILKRVDQLKKPNHERVEELADEIEELVDLIRNPDRIDPILPSDVYQLLDECLNELQLTDHVEWVGARPPVPPIPALIRLALKRAATEVLKNSHSHLRPGYGGRTRVVMRANVTKRGGLPHLVVLVKQSVDKLIAEPYVPVLYRMPIEFDATEGRRHFGAFIAGYWLRAIGGDVYLTQNEVSDEGHRYVETALDIPILTVAPEGP